MISAHYIAHWGTPGEIVLRKNARVQPLAVMTFPPRPGRPNWRIASNGMHAIRQGGKGGDIRCELFVSSGTTKEWMFDLLESLAAYPIDYNLTLGQNHTIDVGQPIDQHSSNYSGLLLSSPFPWDPMSLELPSTTSDVRIWKILPLLPSELDFARNLNGTELFKKLEVHGDRLIDGEQPAVV